jgi:hypothetical protein
MVGKLFNIESMIAGDWLRIARPVDLELIPA